MPQDMPELCIDSSELTDAKIWIVKLLVKAEMAPSNSEARRLIQQGGITLDGEKVKDPSANLTINNGQILKAGKLKFAKIILK